MAHGTFANKFSIEATRPNDGELRKLAGILAPGTQIYLSSVSKQSYTELAQTVARVRAAGFEPVPHVAARRLSSAETLQQLLTDVRKNADVRRLLVVGGDIDPPAGPFKDALAVIHAAKFREAGIEEIGITGYPVGHPKIAAADIEQALDAKIATAVAAGLKVHIVSQFCFEPERIVAWVQRLRAAGFRQPVKIGMAGPTSATALLRYALRCGVNASLRGLTSGVAADLVGNVGPDRIIEAIDAAGDIGDTSAHYFSFGGLIDTARYANKAAAGIASGRAVAQSG